MFRNSGDVKCFGGGCPTSCASLQILMFQAIIPFISYFRGIRKVCSISFTPKARIPFPKASIFSWFTHPPKSLKSPTYCSIAHFFSVIDRKNIILRVEFTFPLFFLLVLCLAIYSLSMFFYILPYLFPQEPTSCIPFQSLCYAKQITNKNSKMKYLPTILMMSFSHKN